MAKPRTRISTATAAAVLFAADRTCCVCRKPGKSVQIHHLDEDPTNHEPDNLAVLCRDCHEDTQVKGGFSRRLDADQVRLYRDSSNQAVAARRSTSTDEDRVGAPLGAYDAELATSLVEIEREAGNWVNLAFVYDGIGNEELRDKAVDKAVSQGVSEEVLLILRRLQGRVGDVPPEVIEAELGRQTEEGGYRIRAFIHEDLRQYREAADTYLEGLQADLPSLSAFTVAHHLKELMESEVIPGLFVEALQEAADKDDLWWQVRSLQELGWTSELDALVLENEERIATDPDLVETQRLDLRMIAALAKGDYDAYREARIVYERIEAQTEWGT